MLSSKSVVGCDVQRSQVCRKAPVSWPGLSGGFRHPVDIVHRSREVQAAARRTKTTTSFGDIDKKEIDPDRKLQLIDTLMSNINGRYGTGSIMKLNQRAPNSNLPTFSSGSLTLDAALGGGYPRGRLVEIYGPESSGKTTLALHAVAEVQKAGGYAAFIDVEHAFDAEYARSLGVKDDKLMFCQPDTGEQALEIMDEVARSSCLHLVVIDSVAALVPRAELEGEIGNLQVGSQARLLSQGLRKLAASASKSNTTLMFLNQLRNKVGVIYGNPETTSGGNALKYYSSVRVDIRKKEIITDGDGKSTGIKVKAKIVKNKVAAPHREAFFDIVFGTGIDSMGGLVDAAEATEVISRRGAWYYYGDSKLAQGREKTLALLRETPDLFKTVEDAVRAKLASDPNAFASQDGEAADVEPDLNDDLLQ